MLGECAHWGFCKHSDGIQMRRKCVCVCVCVLGRKLDVVPIQCPRGGDSYPAFELDLGRRKIRSVLGSVKKPVIRHGRTESIIS